MNVRARIVFIVVLVLTLVVVGPVSAQEEDDEGSLCTGENVSGTVVAVDEEAGTVTIDTGVEQCTVTVDGGYDHPIVTLMGAYFGDGEIDLDSLVEAQEATQGCAVYDAAAETWSWVGCDVEDSVPATVVGENEDGTFILQVEGEEETVDVAIDDPDAVDDLGQALDALSVDWDLNGDGEVVQAGDEIAAYHEDGLGFGVLVKLYAMAGESAETCAEAGEPGDETCGVTLEELIEAHESGVGLGELFQEYGRPSILGIGHVHQQVKDKHRHRNKTGHRFGEPEEEGEDEDGEDEDGMEDGDANGPPDHAGPRENDGGGPPDHAGPKQDNDDGNGNGPPDHAGPKQDNDDGNGNGPPDHAGPKKPKKGD